MTIRVAAVALFLCAVSGASAQGLSGSSTGADWLAATNEQKARWTMLFAGALKGSTTDDPGRHALRAMRCVTEALTVRRPGEAVAVEQYKRSTLAELSSLCAVMEAK